MAIGTHHTVYMTPVTGTADKHCTSRGPAAHLEQRQRHTVQDLGTLYKHAVPDACGGLSWQHGDEQALEPFLCQAPHAALQAVKNFQQARKLALSQGLKDTLLHVAPAAVLQGEEEHSSAYARLQGLAELICGGQHAAGDPAKAGATQVAPSEPAVCCSP